MVGHTGQKKNKTEKNDDENINREKTKRVVYEEAEEQGHRLEQDLALAIGSMILL